MSGVFLGGDFLAVYDALSRLLGLDLSAYNDDAVFLISEEHTSELQSHAY